MEYKLSVLNKGMFDAEEIERLRQVYNKEHKREEPIPKGSPEEVWAALTRRMQENCSTGSAECILASLMNRPKAPKEWALDRSEWLSSEDIDAVEKNYVQLFPDYEYLGALPIDFDLKSDTGKCLISTLCSLNIKDLAAKGKHRIGVVMNTDPHDGPGQHWVAVFCDIRPELEFPRMTYFDSYAYTPEPEIQKLMARWKEQWTDGSMQLTYNKLRHQYRDSECGMYCVYFHYACLLEIPMEDRIPDDVMNGFRDMLFQMPKIESGDKK
jgi:hypothetical protein